MRPIVFELCADNLQACLAAREGGADRIEICSALSEGGLTPSHGLVCEAIEQSGLATHAMLRPRGGNFVYTKEELCVMHRDLMHLRQLGVQGVVLGVLCLDGTVDQERTAQLVRMAAPLEVTFHRAFDETPDLSRSLEEVIATGCRRVLTSGGKLAAVDAIPELSRLATQAAGRIDVAVAGKLRLKDAAILVQSIGASHFHSSMRHFGGDKFEERLPTRKERLFPAVASYVDSADIRAMIETLSHA